MRFYDKWTGLFWTAFAVFVCVESLRLGIGTPGNPGMGLMAFGSSVLLGILSLALVLREVRTKDRGKPEPLFSGVLWKRIVLVMIALFVYEKVLTFAGYLVSTFFLMILLFGMMEKQKFRWVLFQSFLTTVITYYFFSKGLDCQLPVGKLGF